MSIDRDATLRGHTTAAISIAVVEDHALLAFSLVHMLREHGYGAESVMESTPSAIVGRVSALAPDIVLLDLDLGELGSSVPLIAPIRASSARVVIITGESSRVRWAECIEAGAYAVLSKSLQFDTLVERISETVRGETQSLAAERGELMQLARKHREEQRELFAPFARLTAREAHVLAAMTLGLCADDIAASSFISLPTVRSHIRSILTKLGVRSQLAAVALATQCHWRPPIGQ